MSTDRLLRMGKGQTASYNPLTKFAWHHAFWAQDPHWAHPADGGQVAVWRDGTGNGWDARQPVDGRQPNYRAATPILNNKAAIDGDGYLAFLKTDSFPAVGLPYTVVGIGSFGGIAGGTYLWDNGPATVGVFYDNGTTAVTLFNGNPMQLNVDTDQAGHLFVGVFDTATTGMVDLIERTAGAGVYTATRTTLFANDGGIGNNSGQLAFFGLYAGDIRTNTAAWLEFKAWAQSHYGVTVI